MQLGGESAERSTSQISSRRKEWETEPAAWVGSVLQPTPSQALAAAAAAQTSPLALPIPSPVGLPLHCSGALDSSTHPCWLHPNRWLLVGRPGQEASSLCSPQAEWHHPGVSPGPLQLCSLSFASTSTLAPQMLCRPKYGPLHGQGSIYHPLNSLRGVCPHVPGAHPNQCSSSLHKHYGAEKPAGPRLQCRTSDPCLPVSRIL